MQAAARNRKKKTSPMRIAFFILLAIAVSYSFLWAVVTKGLTPEVDASEGNKPIRENQHSPIEASAQDYSYNKPLERATTTTIPIQQRQETSPPVAQEIKQPQSVVAAKEVKQPPQPPQQHTASKASTPVKRQEGSLGMRSDGRMNVLFLVADDMRSQAMIYGKETYTPSLARLAARGVVFDRAYAQVTVCNPSRNSFLSGRIPDVTQVWNFERTVGSEMVTLPVYFRGQGYNVLGAGKIWHWAPGPGESWSEDVAEFWPDSKVYQNLIRHERALQNATVTPMDLPADEFMDAQISSRASKLLRLLEVGGREENAKDPNKTPKLLTPYTASKRLEEQAGEYGSPLDARDPFFFAVGFHLPHEPYLFPSNTWKMYDDVEMPLLRGKLAKRPFGMPAYALGDVQAPFSYFNREKDLPNSERHGRTYGPHEYWLPELSTKENKEMEHAYPDRMRFELLKGYCAGVTFMDSQLGKVLDTLKSTGLEESTVVVFFSDHGFAMGERGQWGKRSLFESDARVPLIFADPRYKDGHGTHTSAFAELVDVFPTLTELAGIAPPHAVVPPISGVSLAEVIRRPKDLELLKNPPREGSMTQFSRCPITASEYLTDISGFGPMVNFQGKVREYRSRPHHGAIAWECTWKGWEWGEHHDLSVMGYSLRTQGWRYTAWVPWDFNATMGVWTWPPFAEELYQHELDPNEPPNLFDELETVNLLAVDGFEDKVQPVKEEHKRIGKELFGVLREMVIERRGVADDAFYMCNRIGNRGKREQCQADFAAQRGFSISMKSQLKSTEDSREAQRQGDLFERLKEPVPSLPLAPHTLPKLLETNLRRLRLIPDHDNADFNDQVFEYEKVVKEGDLVVVGDIENRIKQLIHHHEGKESETVHGIRYRVKSVLDPTLVPAPFHGHDLLLELAESHATAACAGDTIAMNLGYVPRHNKEALMKLTGAQKKNMPPFPYEPSQCELGKLGPLSSMFSEEVIEGDDIPGEIYVQSREMATREGAGWADRTDHVQWLPVNLAEFDKRVGEGSETREHSNQNVGSHQNSDVSKKMDVSEKHQNIQSSNTKPWLLTPSQQAEVTNIEEKVEALSRCVILDEDPMGFLKSVKQQQGSGGVKTSAGGDAGITVDGLSEEGECIEPYIEIKRKIKVHLVPLDVPPQGVRFSHLIQQGLMKHPAVELVDFSPSFSFNSSNPPWADLVLYLPTSTRKPPYFLKPEEMANQKQQQQPPTTLSSNEGRKRLVVLDEGDGNGFFPPVKDAYMAYFKRSWPHRKNGKAVGLPRRLDRSYFPMAYSMSDEYTAPMFDHANPHGHGDTLRMIPADLRRYHVSCTLRVHETQPARTRVVNWVKRAVEDWQLSVSGGVVGEVNTGQRREINKGYFKTLASAQIIVTCNPSNWEGDFRMWEAMSSGALVFVDEMSTPMPNAPIDGEHIVVYDNNDEEAFLLKLKYYVDHPTELRRVAHNGFLHALKYHRAVSRVDWILRSALEVQASEGNFEDYTHMVETFSETGEMIKDNKGTDGSLQIKHL